MTPTIPSPLGRVPPVHSPVDAPAAVRSLLGRRPGNAVGRLQRLLEERFDADQVVLCGSGTHALQLALTLARMATGRDAVALPAYTCYDLVTAALGARARPVFYDLDPDTLEPEPAALQRALSESPAAIVAVHHFGIPTELASLLSAADRGTWVIEDAAQAHGGSLEGRRAGALAPLSVLSFGRGKGWTGGAGGALLLRGDEAAELASAARAEVEPAPPGLVPALKLGAQWLLGRPALYAIPAALPFLGLGQTLYHPPSPVTGLPERTAGLLLASDARAEWEAGARRSNAARLRSAADDAPFVAPFPERGRPGYLRLPLRVPGRAAEAVLGPEARALGLLPSYPRPLPELEALGSGPREPTPAGAAALARELFTAPTHSLLTEALLERIEAVLYRLQ